MPHTHRAAGDNANASLNTAGVVVKDESSPEGLVLAYGSIILMSLVPIVLGSWRSVRLRGPPVAGRSVANSSSSSGSSQHHNHQHHHHRGTHASRSDVSYIHHLPHPI